MQEVCSAVAKKRLTPQKDFFSISALFSENGGTKWTFQVQNPACVSSSFSILNDFKCTKTRTCAKMKQVWQNSHEFKGARSPKCLQTQHKMKQIVTMSSVLKMFFLAAAILSVFRVWTACSSAVPFPSAADTWPAFASLDQKITENTFSSLQHSPYRCNDIAKAAHWISRSAEDLWRM